MSEFYEFTFTTEAAMYITIEPDEAGSEEEAREIAEERAAEWMLGICCSGPDAGGASVELGTFEIEEED